MMLRDSRGGTPMDTGAFLPITDAANYLGVARSTVYRLIKTGKLSVYRLTPDTPRLKRTDLDAYAEGTREGGQA